MSITETASSSDGRWPNREIEDRELDRRVDALQAECIRIRRHLHSHPEPSGEEVETSAHIAQRLTAVGLSPRICRSDAGRPVGVIADVDIGKPSPDCPLIAIRCDIDALRMPDDKTVDYRSQNPGVAHACGHDAHTSIVLGIGLTAGTVDPSVQTVGMRLRMLFQAAEEISGGARWLVDQNALDGVSMVLGMHVDPERSVGEVGIRYGALTANCDEVDIAIDGHGGHAARPHHSVDPVAAAAQLIGAFYQQLPRTVDSRHPAVFTIGQINGGYAANVIPERVELRGTLRTTDDKARRTKKQGILAICAGIAQATGTRIEATFTVPLNSVINDHRVTSAIETTARRVLGSANVKNIERPSMGGEDFSVYLDHVPGAMFRLGCAAPGTEPAFLHSPLFDIDERAIGFGMKILLRAALLLSAEPTEQPTKHQED